VGFYCNQACKHCHVDSSPLRKEMMSRHVADRCLELLARAAGVRTLDLTGGAPELNREFRRLVSEARARFPALEIIDRCNLTVLLEPHQEDLVAFLAQHRVRVIASLPCYLEDNVSKQRGDQVFERSVHALRLLNGAGFGVEGSGLFLDLVYNPVGVHLPPQRDKLELDYKRVLKERYGVSFTRLHCITNMPINRFLDDLKSKGKLEAYMDILVNAFNPHSVEALMCRSYVSVDPKGMLFDCDFNQQLDLHLAKGATPKLSVFDIESLDDILDVKIVTRKHCYGCTAGAGSSCRTAT
jgi:radical SAM/Cys-rich protein